MHEHDPTTSSTHERRGRPLVLPVDGSAPTDLWYEPWPRMAWVLVTSRLAGADRTLVQREALVERLRDLGVAADLSRVSRWESGRQPVPAHVLSAYETVLGRPAGSLVTLSRMLVRSSAPSGTRQAPRPSLVAPASESPLDDLLDRATDPSGAPLAAGEWLALALELARYDTVYLGPPVWRQLCESLMNQLARSVGAEAFVRYEACVELVSHPVARRPMMRALGQWLTDPDVMVTDPMMGLLLDLEDRGATDLAVRLLHSATPAVAEMAMPIMAAKIARQHVDGPGLDLVERWLTGRLGELAGDAATLDVLAHLPRERASKVLAEVRDTETRRRLASIVDRRGLVDAQVSRASTRTIAAHARSDVDWTLGDDSDRMLHRLLREALHGVHGVRRYLASHTLALSPFADSVAGSAVTLAGRSEPVVATQAYMLARWIGPTTHADALADAALSDTRPGPQTTGLQAMSQDHRPLDGVVGARTCGLAVGTPHPAVRAAAANVLGLRSPATLQALAGSHPDLTRAATWWRRTGPVLDDHAPAHAPGGPPQE